jgi:hypothetical protein
MPLLGFQKRFAPLVKTGEKRQTIRAYRKDGRDPKLGDTLYLYAGLRTQQCRKLGEAVVREVLPFGIDAPFINVDRKLYETSAPRIRRIAKADGFYSVTEMIAWFEKTHGLPFVGQLIRWGEIEPRVPRPSPARHV